MSSPILAAGAVLWRPGPDGVQVALVHRPRYRDWSLPKGKADPAETSPVTAWREVREETGFCSALGRSLTQVSYRVAGRPKTVHYYAARALDGKFVPNREVDKLEWLTLPKARARLIYEFDRAVLDTFARQPVTVRTVVLVRHARAGQRESWVGADRTRPLDGKGNRQAKALAGLLLPFGPRDVVSAPLTRCTQTVGPLAERLGLHVRIEAALAEDAYRDDPACARRRLVDLVDEFGDDPGCLVAASQGGVIPGTVKSLAARGDIPLPKAGTPKAAGWVLTFDGRRLVQADFLPAPEV